MASPQNDFFDDIDNAGNGDFFEDAASDQSISQEEFFANDPGIDSYDETILSDPWYDDSHYKDYDAFEGPVDHGYDMGEVNTPDSSVSPEDNPAIQYGSAIKAPGEEPYYIPGPPVGAMLEPFQLEPQGFALDPQQQAVVDHNEGAALVVAGAGSGKTRVVIDLTAKRLSHGVSPAGYVMLTFSRKAAGEMTTRLKARLGFDSGVDPTTFHSFFFKMMTRSPKRFGLPSGFSIMDEKDQTKIFEYILDDLGVDRAAFPSVQWQSGYSYCKNDTLRAGTTIEDMYTIIRHMRHFLKPMEAGKLIEDETIAQALVNYETYTQSNGLMDYDDLILKPLEVFDADPEIARRYSEQVKYLIVDEAQDTNLAQYRLVKHLGSVNKNVLMVGDDDQSIYGWRGARPENMRQFMDDFKAKEYLIENNYRCAPEIVSKATSQVRRNVDRLEKNPKSAASHATRGEVNLVTAPNSFALNKDLLSRIRRAIQSGTEPGKIAILYRGNRMLNEIEGDLIKAKIPYHVAGTSKLMDRQEAKACIAVARMVVNNHDSAALWTAAKMLPGVGDTAIARLVAHSDVTGKPLLSDDGIAMVKTTKGREALERFRGVINKLRRGTPAEWITTIKAELEPLEMFKGERKSKPANFKRREGNIDQLEQWSKNMGCDNWHEFFEILLEQEDPSTAKPNETIAISTIHKAKGLEWDHVFLYGFSQSIFPMENKKEGDDSGDLTAINPEEERRLSYVGITRAAKYFYAMHAGTYRTIPDKRFTLSPFASEIQFNNHYKLQDNGPSQHNQSYRRGGGFKAAAERNKRYSNNRY